MRFVYQRVSELIARLTLSREPRGQISLYLNGEVKDGMIEESDYTKWRQSCGKARLELSKVPDELCLELSPTDRIIPHQGSYDCAA